MNKFKSKKKLKYNLGLIVITILIMSILELNYINQRSSRLTTIAKGEIEIINNKIIMENVNKEEIKNTDLNSLINFTYNSKKEIIAIDYNMNLAYTLMSKIVTQLKSGLATNYTNIDNTRLNNKAMVLSYPIGILSDNLYLNNLGSKIPVIVLINNSLMTGIKTKVSNYGINNVLMELYINIELSNNIILPVVKEKLSKTYEVLIASKIVVGSVPSYYNGTLEKESKLITN